MADQALFLETSVLCKHIHFATTSFRDLQAANDYEYYISRFPIPKCIVIHFAGI